MLCDFPSKCQDGNDFVVNKDDETQCTTKVKPVRKVILDGIRVPSLSFTFTNKVVYVFHSSIFYQQAFAAKSNLQNNYLVF